MDDDLLAEQRAFYRARAPEYDDWWLRRGPYDRGDADTAEWERQVAVLDDALADFGATGNVLEIAGGTGWWTQRLARTARSLTVLDGAPEAVAINRERVQRDDVEYVIDDVFSWTPARRYDEVFFSFWLSHVPRHRFVSFWELVASCLAPGGRVFLMDNRNDPQGGPGGRDPHVLEYREDEHLRRVSDGSEFRVVKVMYEPDELEHDIRALGWNADMRATRYFVFGSARPNGVRR